MYLHIYIYICVLWLLRRFGRLFGVPLAPRVLQRAGYISFGSLTCFFLCLWLPFLVHWRRLAFFRGPWAPTGSPGGPKRWQPSGRQVADSSPKIRSLSLPVVCHLAGSFWVPFARHFGLPRVVYRLVLEKWMNIL